MTKLLFPPLYTPRGTGKGRLGGVRERRVLLLLFCYLFTFILFPFSLARAQGVSCTATVTPHTLTTNQGASLTFAITNTGDSNAIWMRISAPSDNFQVLSGSSAGGWGARVNNSDTFFTGSSVAAGEAHNFTVNAQSGLTPVEAQAWIVQISSAADGSSSTTCSGDTSVAITGDNQPPVISSIAAINVLQNEATIQWITDKPSTSLVRYGTSPSYGSSKTDATARTTHSLKLSSLSPGITYHYQVESVDDANNTAMSGDKVFTTASSGINNLTITGVNMSAITTNSINIQWITNNPAFCNINYGTSPSYGQAAAEPGSLIINHGLAINSLRPDSSYYFNINCQDGNNQTATSGNNAFNTVASSNQNSGNDGGGGSNSGSGGNSDTNTGSSTSKTTGKDKSTGNGKGSGSGQSTNPIIEKAAPVIRDLTPPTVRLSTKLDSSYKKAPELSGLATDNYSVQSVAYSIDGGRNWLPIKNTHGLRTHQTTYTFTPSISQDDNYQLRLRAVDASGNAGFSPDYLIVIDTMPPRIGSFSYTTYTQPIQTSPDLPTAVVAGIEQKITVSAMGGPTSMAVVAKSSTSDPDQTFLLTRNPETNLWSGAINLAKSGSYQLVFHAEDGAGNITERIVSTVLATAGATVKTGGKAVPGAEVTAWQKDVTTDSFAPWNATPFQQTNPQITNQQGNFQLILPPGTYYISIQAPGFRPMQTRIFTLRNNQLIGNTYELTPLKYLRLGPIEVPIPPLFWPETVPAPSPSSVMPETKIPATALQKLDLSSVVLDAPITKPTVLSFLSSWSPNTSEQLANLEIAKAQGVSVKVILMQATATEAALLADRGKYSVPIIADPLGQLADMLATNTSPMHVVIRPDGSLDSRVYGLLNAEQVQQMLR